MADERTMHNEILILSAKTLLETLAAIAASAPTPTKKKKIGKAAIALRTAINAAIRATN